ncbi:MAG: hypothetical protein IPQ01_05600 [Zoogloea sp.]|jgi:hypothetical protein|nr:hypothetical protein [Zoogloea sp.]
MNSAGPLPHLVRAIGIEGLLHAGAGRAAAGQEEPAVVGAKLAGVVLELPGRVCTSAKIRVMGGPMAVQLAVQLV